MLAERDALLARRDELVAQLEQQLAVLTKMVFGPRSEKQLESVDLSLAAGGRQPFLFLKEIAAQAQKLAEEKEVVATVELKHAAKPVAKKARRTTFPDHLPRVTTTVALPSEQRLCCGQEMSEMGREVTRELERVETFVVHEIVRKKYCCRVCQEHVKIAPGPARVIEKGMLSTSALAHLIVERFGNHLPYHRLEKKYAAEGIDLSRSVLCRSALACAELLKPIWEQMKAEIQKADLIQSDDTPVVLEESSLGGRKTARLWIYRDLEDRQLYDFTESRSRDGPEEILLPCAGFLQVDAFGGYDGFFRPGSKLIEVGCWAHARRYFKRALDSEQELAKEAIVRIRELYAIERAAKEQQLDRDRVLRLRQEHAVPLLERFKTWLEVTRTQVLDKGPLAKAIGYALKNWVALKRYTTDGRIPIDNNAAERSLRAVAVGRKNWIQIGNVRGGEGAAILFSVVQTCKAIGVDPKTYVQDVLLRVANEADASKLTPHGWKMHFASSVAAARDQVLSAAVAAR